MKEKKCRWYLPVMRDTIYENFSFQHLDSWKDVVFEDGKYHAPFCAEGMYRLTCSSDVNQCCNTSRVSESGYEQETWFGIENLL